jgi:hypothetical protein
MEFHPPSVLDPSTSGRCTVRLMAARWPSASDFAAYHAPRVERPPVPEAPLEERVIEGRRLSGLPLDRRNVERAMENVSRPDYELPGLWFTPEERQESYEFDHELPGRIEAAAVERGAEVGGVALAWLNGKQAIEIWIKEDVEHYRDLLTTQFGAEPIIVSQARYSQRELSEFQERVSQDQTMLADLGIDLHSSGPHHDGLHVDYFAADQPRAEALLRDRYGPMVIPNWIGSSAEVEEPQTFGSYISEGTTLTVFYALDINADRPGNCTVQEYADRVVVSLTILAWKGARTLVGGWRPSHASVELSRPVGDRTVIDAAAGVARPGWTSADGPGDTPL